MQAFNRTELKKSIRPCIIRIWEAQQGERDLYKNTLDCFSASLDALVQRISLDEWVTQEQARQVQKAKQNAMGDLHHLALGAISGVDALATGGVVDIVSHSHQLIAEIKNKHNTTKGNHKKEIYDDLDSLLARNYQGYTGYYVEILPKSQKSYNECFTPPDNVTKTNRPQREDIRVIDGRSFYALLTGFEDAIDELYQELPILAAEIIEDEFNVQLEIQAVVGSGFFGTFFEKAYG